MQQHTVERHNYNTMTTKVVGVRTTFNIEMKVDNKLEDEERRKVFIDLVLEKARELFGVSNMLAETPIKMSVNMIDGNGKHALPLLNVAELGVEADEEF